MKRALGKISSVILVLCVLAAVLPFSALAAEGDVRSFDGSLKAALSADYAEGDGTEEDPYLISTEGQLNSIRDHLDKHFRLTADLDLSGYISGSGWEYIGTSEDPFTGSLDGDGYSIDGLFIHREGVWDVRTPSGLFGYIGAQAKVFDLTLINANVTGCYYVGSLAGVNNGEISNVIASGIVSGEWDTGGLVGRNIGTITGSVYTGNVNGVNGDIEYGEWTGGLVGYNLGAISNCGTFVTVTGDDDNIGGLVGESLEEGSITESFSLGTVTGGDYSGGLIGANSSEITACYSICTVNGNTDTGGLVGENSGNIENSYAAGAVEGTFRFGGLAGSSTGATFTECYWDTQTSGLGVSAGGAGKTTNEMKQRSTYENWDFDTVWDIDAGVNDGYPYLRRQALTPPESEFAGGDGSVADPYIVSNANQLNNVRYHLDKHFIQSGSIDLSSYRSGEGWVPIGDNHDPFTGTYDGNDFSVSNLYIERDEYYT